MQYSSAIQHMQYGICNIACAIQPLVCSVAAVSGHKLYPDAIYLSNPRYVGRIFLSMLSYAGKLGFVVTEIRAGGPLGFARTREGWRIYWSLDSFGTSYLGFSETWVKTKGFDLQSHSSLALYTLHTSMISTAPVFLLPSAQKVLPNSRSCLVLSPWFLALFIKDARDGLSPLLLQAVSPCTSSPD